MSPLRCKLQIIQSWKWLIMFFSCVRIQIISLLPLSLYSDTSTGNLSSCKIFGGLNQFMKLQFLVSVELFFQQLNGYSFWPGRNYVFHIKLQFPLCEIRPKTEDARIIWSWQERTVHGHPCHDGLYLHFILWSGTRKLHFKGVRMFQAIACGELTRQHGLICKGM